MSDAGTATDKRAVESLTADVGDDSGFATVVLDGSLLSYHPDQSRWCVSGIALFKRVLIVD